MIISSITETYGTLACTACLLLCACGNLRQVPVHSSDSVSVTERIETVVVRDTVTVHLPAETFRDSTPVRDTLKLETSLACAQAWVDTASNSLKGNITNKADNPMHKPVDIRLKNTERETVRTVVREIPVTVEVPQPYVPAWCKLTLAISILSLFILLLKVTLRIALKIKGLR